MPLEYTFENSLNKVTDYIYLLRTLKFSKKGLINLFKNPNINIGEFKKLNKDRIAHFLLMGQQLRLDQNKKIDYLFQFDFNDESYVQINDMVKYCIENQISIITPNSDHIPKIFAEIPEIGRDLIFVKGSITDNDLKSYSICGTRNPTPDAKNKTQQIAFFLAQKGFTLINGFARGIDIEAFHGAYKGDGRYLGILASGVENIYPPENRQYIPLVLKNGAFLSQRLIWNRVNEQALQMRNRFSAQLSLGSIFIEGNFKSGTKWQFKFAQEARKPVFYLEPQDWNHENAHVPKMIKEQGGHEIKNDLSNLDEVFDILSNQFKLKVAGIDAR